MNSNSDDLNRKVYGTEVFDNVRHGTKLITTSWALFMLLPGEASPSIQPGPKSPDGPPVATVPGLGDAALVHAADCHHRTGTWQIAAVPLKEGCWGRGRHKRKVETVANTMSMGTMAAGPGSVIRLGRG